MNQKNIGCYLRIKYYEEKIKLYIRLHHTNPEKLQYLDEVLLWDEYHQTLRCKAVRNALQVPRISEDNGCCMFAHRSRQIKLPFVMLRFRVLLAIIVCYL